MPADRRLTIETARVGMQVRWADNDFAPPTTIRHVSPGSVQVAGHVCAYHPNNFIPADPEPAPSWATEELRKALVEWASPRSKLPLIGTPDACMRLFLAARDAGLLRAPASTTDRAASIDGEWFV